MPNAARSRGHQEAHDFALEMVPLAKLKIDNDIAKGGYARPVSQDRLKKLRERWDFRKVGSIEVSLRGDRTMWLINGQHRREILLEKGVDQWPAMVYKGLDRQAEADLYLGLGDTLPQQALSMFWARISMGEREAKAVRSAVESVGLKISVDYRSSHTDDGTLVAINRLERIYAVAGGAGLREVLQLARDAWGLDHRAYQQAMLEALFQFWAAYHTSYDRERLVGRLREVGIDGVSSKAYTIRARGGWSRTVDSLIAATHEIYHEAGIDGKRVLRSYQLAPWNGRRARPLTNGQENVQSFAPGTRAARVDKARREREQLKLVQ